jgi:hypothetical protein
MKTIAEWKRRLQPGVQVKQIWNSREGDVSHVFTLEKVQSNGFWAMHSDQTRRAWSNFPKRGEIEFTEQGWCRIEDSRKIAEYVWVTTFEENLARFHSAASHEGEVQLAREWLCQLDDAGLRLLWDAFGNTPVYDQDAINDMGDEYDLPVEGMKDDMIDEDFVIWKRGTPRMEIWQWFDERFSEGLVKGSGMYGTTSEDEEDVRKACIS